MRARLSTDLNLLIPRIWHKEFKSFYIIHITFQILNTANL